MTTWRIALGLCFPFAAGCSAGPSDAIHLAAGHGPGVVAVADFNGDGKRDIAVVNEQSGDVTVLLGDGGRGFKSAPGSPFAAGHNPNDMTVADFNGDGHRDLAFANHDTQYLTVLLGDGHGAFAPAPGSPVPVAVVPHPHGIAAADLNGDGKADLVTDSWGNNQLEILHGDGKGGFDTHGIYLAVGRHPYQRIRVADLNGDGRADIVSPNLDGGDVTILLSDGRGGFTQASGSPFPCGDSPFNVAIGDLNADGRPDLAIVNSPSSAAVSGGRDGLTILLGDGRGHFATMRGAPWPMDRFPNIAAIGDIDGDGAADIAVSDPDGDFVMLFTMGRNGVVKSTAKLSVSGHPKGLAIADFNGDGKGDLVVSNNTEDRVTVIFGK